MHNKSAQSKNYTTWNNHLKNEFELSGDNCTPCITAGQSIMHK